MGGASTSWRSWTGARAPCSWVERDGSKVRAAASVSPVYELAYTKNKGPPREFTSIWPGLPIVRTAVITPAPDNVSGFLPPV